MTTKSAGHRRRVRFRGARPAAALRSPLGRRPRRVERPGQVGPVDRRRRAQGRPPARRLARQPQRRRDPRAAGVRARSTSFPATPELVVISVPAAAFEEAVDASLAAGAKAIVAITAGLGEVDDDGRELERRVVEKVRAGGRGDARPQLPRRLRRRRSARSRHERVHARLARDHLPERQPRPRAEPARRPVRDRDLARSPRSGTRPTSRRPSSSRRSPPTEHTQRDRRLLRGLPRRPGVRPRRRGGAASGQAGRPARRRRQRGGSAGRRLAHRCARERLGGGRGGVPGGRDPAGDDAEAAGRLRPRVPRAAPAGGPTGGDRRRRRRHGRRHRRPRHRGRARAAAALRLRSPPGCTAIAPTIVTANPVDLAGAGEQDFWNFERVTSAVLESGEVDAVIFAGYFGGYSQMNERFSAIETEVAPRDRAAAAAERPAAPRPGDVLGLAARRARCATGGVPVYRDIEAAVDTLARLVGQQRAPSHGVPERPERRAADRRRRLLRVARAARARRACRSRPPGAPARSTRRARRCGARLPGRAQGARAAAQVGCGRRRARARRR